MSQALAVAARELRERWLFFPGGLACGFFPLVLPAFGVPVDGATLVGVFGAIFLGLGAGLIAGASMLARDTVDGRLGFLFSRPVPWPAIWGGKWLAATVLGASTAALTALPWVLVFPAPPGAPPWTTAVVDPQGASFYFVLLLLAVGFANFNATAVRSRSAWVALDLGLLIFAIWLVRRWVAPLYYLHIFGPHPMAGPWGFLILLGPPAVALVVASAAQTAFGRTDLRRAHRSMSLAFWAVLFLALAAGGLRLAWARAATPADVLMFGAGSCDPSGRWLYANAASRRGGSAEFLIDTEQGRYVPLGVRPPWGGHPQGLVFAADGSSGVILVHGAEHSELVTVDLSRDTPRFATVELENSPPPDGATWLVLSPSGAHVLLAHDHGASLFVASTGRRVTTATVPPGWRPADLRFVGESLGRVWLIPSFDSGARAEMRVLELGVDREATTTPVSLAAPVDPVRDWPHLVHSDASGERVLTRDGGLHLRDGETGALLATLLEGPTVSPGPYLGTRTLGGVFLADGRIVVGQAVGARTVLHVFDPDGSPLDQLDLDRVPAGLAVGPEMAPGRLGIRVGSSSAGPETLVVDLAERGVVETLAGRPLCGPWGPGAPRTTAAAVHFLVRPDDGAIVRRDFGTGEERVVAGAGAVPGERLAGF